MSRTWPSLRERARRASDGRYRGLELAPVYCASCGAARRGPPDSRRPASLAVARRTGAVRRTARRWIQPRDPPWTRVRFGSTRRPPSRCFVRVARAMRRWRERQAVRCRATVGDPDRDGTARPRRVATSTTNAFGSARNESARAVAAEDPGWDARTRESPFRAIVAGRHHYWSRPR